MYESNAFKSNYISIVNYYFYPKSKYCLSVISAPLTNIIVLVLFSLCELILQHIRKPSFPHFMVPVLFLLFLRTQEDEFSFHKRIFLVILFLAKILFSLFSNFDHLLTFGEKNDKIVLHNLSIFF